LKRPEVKTIWIVSEGSPGHISQSVGLADALSAVIPVQTVTVKGREKIRGWLRPFVRRLMGTDGARLLSDRLMRHIVNLEIPEKSPVPDLIVSSGGKSIFAARTLAGRYHVPYIFIGERKPYPATWFHTIISPVPGESCANSIDVELIPTPVTPEFIAQKGTVQKGLWCMIAGGASRSHRFKEKDWVNLAEGMNALAEREKIRWLLTTSRRTGAAAEAVLKKHLDPDVLEDAIWWAENPRKELYSFMARSEVLFVTQDSVTMVTEAVSSGKPTITVFPETVVIPESSFMNSYFARLESNKRILRVSAGASGKLLFKQNKLVPLSGNMLTPVAEMLLKRLGWTEYGTHNTEFAKA
jgi:hypothetical protein